jgi:hypothetical protein
VAEKPKSRRSGAATKELEIVRAKDGYGLEIQFVGGGQLPKPLKGKWLNMGDAERAIEMYKITKGK